MVYSSVEIMRHIAMRVSCASALLMVVALGPCEGCDLSYLGPPASDSGPDSGPGDCGPFVVAGASSFSDNFSSGSFSPNWHPLGGACVQEVGGELLAQPVPNSASSNFCYVLTTSNYHLSCDSLTVRVPEVTTQMLGVQTFVYFTAPNGNEFNLLLEGGRFEFQGVGATVAVSGGYNAVTDLWWRLRETAGTLFFETSPDGTAWTVRGQEPDRISFDDVNIGIGAGAWQAMSTPGQARFDCYNVPPPCP